MFYFASIYHFYIVYLICCLIIYFTIMLDIWVFSVHLWQMWSWSYHSWLPMSHKKELNTFSFKGSFRVQSEDRCFGSGWFHLDIIHKPWSSLGVCWHYMFSGFLECESLLLNIYLRGLFASLGMSTTFLD